MLRKFSLLQQGAKGTCSGGVSEHHCLLEKALHETLRALLVLSSPTNRFSCLPHPLCTHQSFKPLCPCGSHPAFTVLVLHLTPFLSHTHNKNPQQTQPLSALTSQLSGVQLLFSRVRFHLIAAIRIQAPLYSLSYQGNIFGKRIFWLQNNLPLSPKVKFA